MPERPSSDRPAGTRREFGRDGVSGLVNADRALRAREVSKPTEADLREAQRVVESLIARATGRAGDGARSARRP